MKIRPVLIALVGVTVVGATMIAQVSGTQSQELASVAEEKIVGEGPSIVIDLKNSTQGPFWPPGEFMDENGDFIVVGYLLTEIQEGVVVPIPGAALVSADTTPPLDETGREDFSNPLGAAYDIVRRLDLSPGSPDLDIELHTNSFGPPAGDFGGGPRIPAEGRSRYNLNSLPAVCPELFPTASQLLDYSLPSYRIRAAPIWGFRGDQHTYDVETGRTFVPDRAEPAVDERTDNPVTLGQWLAAKGQMKITLTQFDQAAGGYTHALFEFDVEGLLPDSIYTVWAIRQALFIEAAAPDPLSLPNQIITDEAGNGSFSVEVANPFPSPISHNALLRIVGIGIDYHPDFQTWGGCFGRLGVGVDASVAFNTISERVDFAPFITVEPKN